MVLSPTTALVNPSPNAPPHSSAILALDLRQATQRSTEVWQKDLQLLFYQAKHRFPDMVWEFVDEDVQKAGATVERVCGHKAILYARAQTTFHNKFLAPIVRSLLSHNPFPSGSPFSLSLESLETPAPSPTCVGLITDLSQSPCNTDDTSYSLLRLATSINRSLFHNELEYLYTGKGYSKEFGMLSEEIKQENVRESYPDAEMVEKLRQDLVFMWRFKLYSDVKISLSGTFGASHENTTVIFSSHRFMLVSRSSYFSDELAQLKRDAENGSSRSGSPTLTLPSPPFTPASLHFTLGYLYTGTLDFSVRTYDLSTAFEIMKAALYLAIPTLHEEIQARIVEEKMHGLFYAFMTLSEYETLLEGKWGRDRRVGCKCRQCARRMPRVLEFALEEDVKNPILERGARRALVGLFGEGWCTREFASLPIKLQASVCKGVLKRSTPRNLFPLLFAAERALRRLYTVTEAWANVVKKAIGHVRARVERLINKQAERCFSMEEGEWTNTFSEDGRKAKDVEWVVGEMLRGATEAWAPTVHQERYLIERGRNLDGWISRNKVVDNSSIRCQTSARRLHTASISLAGAQFIREQAPQSAGEKSAREYCYAVLIIKDSTHGDAGGTPTRHVLCATSDEWVDAMNRWDTGVLNNAHQSKSVESDSSVIATGNTELDNPQDRLYEIDSARTSEYSLASSRTATTDYGVYFRRRALSQETFTTTFSRDLGNETSEEDNYESLNGEAEYDSLLDFYF